MSSSITPELSQVFEERDTTSIGYPSLEEPKDDIPQTKFGEDGKLFGKVKYCPDFDEHVYVSKRNRHGSLFHHNLSSFCLSKSVADTLEEMGVEKILIGASDTREVWMYSIETYTENAQTIQQGGYDVQYAPEYTEFEESWKSGFGPILED